MKLSYRHGEFQAEVPCKVNLLLQVCGKRTDGYHEIDTIMLAVDLVDTLSLRPNQSGKWDIKLQFAENKPLTEEDPAWSIPADDKNLVCKALAMFVKEKGIPRAGGEIILSKSIPSMAGLGGGSADAAAALALAQLAWGHDEDTTLIRSLARALGSDINFFLESSHANGYWIARCRGRGEIVTPIEAELSDAWFVIIHPPLGCSTKEIFSRFQGHRDVHADPEKLIQSLKSNQLSTVGGMFHNDLEPAASSLCDWVSRARRWIDRYDHLGQVMSGSGSARFCLCATRDQAETIASEIKGQFSVRAYAVRPWRQSSLADQMSGIRKNLREESS